MKQKEATQGGRAKILVVDQEESASFLCVRNFRDAGHLATAINPDKVSREQLIDSAKDCHTVFIAVPKFDLIRSIMLKDEFEKAHPEITVHLTSVSHDSSLLNHSEHRVLDKRNLLFPCMAKASLPSMLAVA